MTWDLGRPEPLNPYEFAAARLADRTYASKSFPYPRRFSRDAGQPTRFIHKVFDTSDEQALTDTAGQSTQRETLITGRRQVEVVVTRESGNVKEISLQRLSNNSELETLLKLNEEQAKRLVLMMQALPFIPIDGDASVRVDDELIRTVFESPSEVAELYSADPDAVRAIIETDANATDVVAIARRREAVAYFERLLADADFFDECSSTAGGPEHVWQELFEANPWILGIGMSGQFFTSWDEAKLEQTVRGFTFQGGGKRVDALMATGGAVSALAFAEIKHHRLALLGSEYRSDAWQPSTDLTGGVAQVQQTVSLVVKQLGDSVRRLDDEGGESGDAVRVLRPRSYLIVGTLAQLVSVEGGLIQSKYDSFELYRRNLVEPEVLTFDEVLARARWQVALSDTSS